MLIGVFESLPEWQRALLFIIAAIVVAGIFRWTIHAWLPRSRKLIESDLDEMVLEEIEFPLSLTIILGAVFIVLPILDQPDLEFVLGGVILTFLLILWIRSGIRFGSRFVLALRESDRDVDFVPVLKNLWTFFLLFFAFFVLLSIWDVDITPLLASAGVLGIIIGIAAQDTIGNFFAGISLHLDQTYKVGDMIQLETAEDELRGTVTRMTIRSTTLLTRDNIAVAIPNSELNRSRVINESAPQRRRRIRLNVGVAYGSDLELVEETLLRVAEEEPIIMDNPAPVVRYRAFSDSAILAQVQCYIQHPALRGQAMHELIRSINKAFREEGIKIPFPQREVSFFEAGNEIALADQEPSQSGLE